MWHTSRSAGCYRKPWIRINDECGYGKKLLCVFRQGIIQKSVSFYLAGCHQHSVDPHTFSLTHSQYVCSQSARYFKRVSFFDFSGCHPWKSVHGFESFSLWHSRPDQSEPWNGCYDSQTHTGLTVPVCRDLKRYWFWHSCYNSSRDPKTSYLHVHQMQKESNDYTPIV